MGAPLRTPQEIDAQLPEAHGLRAFAKEQLARADQDNGCRMALSVDALDPETSLAGGFSGCGGYAVIWGRKGGRWVEVWGGQDVPACADLRAKGARLNPAVVGQCWDGSAVVPYRP
ncbi:hypothetical protein [Arsenicicoccus sp. oral taxon 190]|uniref:hypothetical protein n=1 Tax=Arsenicicoccus sp. oral taxon 190 TaxID=1658671 RepID=UPI00155D9977|nr:hypothetical protein [Arsenicicoccus sp. oral taxon 190]